MSRNLHLVLSLFVFGARQTENNSHVGLFANTKAQVNFLFNILHEIFERHTVLDRTNPQNVIVMTTFLFVVNFTTIYGMIFSPVERERQFVCDWPPRDRTSCDMTQSLFVPVLDFGNVTSFLRDSSVARLGTEKVGEE